MTWRTEYIMEREKTCLLLMTCFYSTINVHGALYSLSVKYLTLAFNSLRRRLTLAMWGVSSEITLLRNFYYERKKTVSKWPKLKWPEITSKDKLRQFAGSTASMHLIMGNLKVVCQRKGTLVLAIPSQLQIFPNWSQGIAIYSRHHHLFAS